MKESCVFLHNMFVCNNSIISCMTPMYIHAIQRIYSYVNAVISVHNRPLRL